MTEVATTQGASGLAWTREEKDRLLYLARTGATKAQIMAALPNRTWKAIRTLRLKMRRSNFGAHALNQETRRHDGVIVRTIMLHKDDPGERDNYDAQRRDDAIKGNARFVMAMMDAAARQAQHAG